MSALLWFAALIAILIALAGIYYCLVIAFKAFLALFPAVLTILVGALLAAVCGGFVGAVLLLVAFIGAFVVHDRWEGSDLYTRIEERFEKKT